MSGDSRETERLLKAKREKKSDDYLERIIRLISYFVLTAMILMLIKVVYEGLTALTLQFLVDAPRNYMLEGGIGPAIFGTLALVLLMTVMAVPIGISAGIYISEYSGNSFFSRIIKAAVNNLAGVPSIVFGLFGLGFFVLVLGKNLDEVLETGRVFGQPIMLWASATLTILVLPTIITTTVLAFQSIPVNRREAAYSLGATKWQLVRHVLLPHARSGILTGIILSLSRAMGEAAPILFLGCAFYLPDLPLAYLDLGFFSLPLINPADQFMSLPYHIFVLATQSPDPALGMPVQYATTLVLVILIISLNFFSFILRHRFSKLTRLISN